MLIELKNVKCNVSFTVDIGYCEFGWRDRSYS